MTQAVLKIMRKHWIDYLALLVATVALVGGLYSAYLTRLHNRLSVIPHLVVEEYGPHIKYDENTLPEFFLSIKNKGIGPAVIEDIEYISKKVNSVDLLEIARSLGLNRYGFVILSLHNFPTYLGAGDELKIISTDYNYLDSLEPIERAKQLNRIGNLVSEITIQVKYKTLYDEEHEANWPRTR